MNIIDIGNGDPVLALHASASSKTQWRTLASAMSSSLILEVPGDHLMPLNRPADFSRHVARFLAGFPPARMAAAD